MYPKEHSRSPITRSIAFTACALLATLATSGCRDEADRSPDASVAAADAGTAPPVAPYATAGLAADDVDPAMQQRIQPIISKYPDLASLDLDPSTGQPRGPAQPALVAEGAYPVRTPPVDDEAMAFETRVWDQVEAKQLSDNALAQPMPKGDSVASLPDPRLEGPYPTDIKGREVPPKH